MRRIHCFHLTRRLTGVALLCAMLLSLSLFVLPAAAEEAADSLSSVSIMKGGENLEILATLSETYLSDHKGNPVYLLELTPAQNTGDLSALEPAAETKAASKMTFKLSLTTGARTRLTSRFVLAEKKYDGGYTLLGKALYISNPGALAATTYVYPATDSKKGLLISDPTDAEQLGVANTVLTLPVNEYFLGESGENTVSYLYNGKTYYFNRARVSALDADIRSYSNAGINIYLNVLLTQRAYCAFEGLYSLYFDGTDDSARYYAVNTSNETGAAYFEAFMKFISERYTNADRTNGFAGSFIIGYNVNANRFYNSMGERSLADYTAAYANTFRTAWEIVRSSYSNARVFVSVANNFTAPRPTAGADGSDTLDYSAKAFLTKFNERIAASGDIPWSVAINAYPSDRTNTSPWVDSLAENNLETPFITMANIDVLSRFLTQGEFLTNGDVRRIIVSEFGVATAPADGNVTQDAAEKQQAAAFAYAYYRAATNSYIDAVIYNRQLDTAGDGAAFGLWTAPTGTRTAKKYIYDVFENIDQKAPSPLTDFALPILSLTSFSDTIEGFSTNPTPARTVIEGVRTSVVDIEKAYDEDVLFDFTQGDTGSFVAAENANYIELRAGDTADTSLLYAALDASDPFAYMGIDATAKTNFVIDSSRYLTIHMKAEAPADVSSLTFMLRLYSGASSTTGSYVYEGTAQITPGEWTDLTFDIGEYLNKTGDTVKNIKLWVKSTDEKVHEGNFGFYLRTLSLWKKKGLSAFAIILIVLLVIVLLFAGFIGFLFLRGYLRRRRRRLHKQKIAEFKALERERQQRKLEKTLRQMFPDEKKQPPKNGGNGTDGE